jgi:two-component sensor histidine kinase
MYGALSAPDGWVFVEWRVVEAPEALKATLDWTERGGPPVKKPELTGFGSRLLAATAAQLSGDCTVNYEENGLHCRFRFEVPRG